MSRCCRCGCDKINFKVFDFADGDLIWQAFQYNPTIATDGQVYSLTFTEVTGGGAQANNSGVVPVSHGASDTFYEVRCERRDTTGAVVATSPVIDFATDKNLTLWDEMIPGRHLINDSGEYARESTQFFTKQYTVVIDSVTERYCWVPNSIATGNITLVFGSDGASDPATDAVIGMTDNAATIESKITTAFGANLVSVTVTGASFKTQLMQIEIEWASSDHYIATYQYSASRVVGTWTWLQNMRTGIYGTSGGENRVDISLGTGGLRYCWADDGNLFHVGAPGPESGGSYVSSLTQVKLWDTSTDTWTLDWHDDVFIGWNQSNQPATNWGAKNGKIYIGHHRSGTWDDQLWPPRVDGNFSVMQSWDTDGTNFSDHRFGFSSLPFFNANYGLAVTDSGAQKFGLIVGNTVSRFEWENDGGFARVEFENYGQASGGCTALIDETTSLTVDEETNLGQYEPLRRNGSLLGIDSFAGCDNTAAAYYTNITESEAETRLEVTSRDGSGNVGFDGVTVFATPLEGSGIISTITLAEINWSSITWTPFADVNSRVDSSTEWRLKIEGVTATATHTTPWFTQSSTVANVNYELDLLFGSDAAGDPVFEVEVIGTPPSSYTEPLWNQWMILKSHMARTSNSDHTEAGLPAMLGTSNSLATQIRLDVPRVSIEFQNFGLFNSDQLGAVNWLDSTTLWQRNFGRNNQRTEILQCALNDAGLHVLSVSQCSETIPESGGGGPEEEEVPP